MDPMYFDVVIDSALNAAVLPFGSEAIFYAMKSFGGYNMQLVWLLATVGATIGHLFNFMLGVWIYNMSKKSTKGLNEKWYGRVQHYFKKYGVFVLLFSWMILFNLFVVLAGVLRVPLKIALPLVIIGTGLHYWADLL